MRPAVNDPQTTTGDGAARRCQATAAQDGDDPRPEPQCDGDVPAPEEAGYGYGV